MLSRWLPMTVASMLLLTPLPATAQVEADEPGMSRSAPPAPQPHPPATQPQVIDLETTGAPVRPATSLPASLSTLAATSRPPRGPFFRLNLAGGYTGFSVLFGESVHGPTVNGSMAMTFGGGRTKHGLRLGGFFSSMKGEEDRWFDSPEPVSTQGYGVNLGYVAQWKRLWLATGWGLVHVKTESESRSNATLTLPEAYFSLGYDIALGRHLSLRLSGEVGTFIVSWRASASAGLVLRL